MDARIVLTIVASVLVFVGYIPYILDILKGKTTPHVYSWLIGVIVTSISVAGQIHGGAGIISLALVLVTLLSTYILLLSLKFGVRKGTHTDKICLAFCFLAMPLWLISDDPLMTVILVNLIDVIAFVPTLTKTYKYPYSETLFSYQMNAVRFAFVILAVKYYSPINLIYPTTWFIYNLIFVVLISVRRKQLRAVELVG